MEQKYLLIINPNSGQGKYKNYIESIKKYFKKYRMPLDIIITKQKNDATKIAKKHSKSNKYKIIIGAGGDGTINEVLNGVVGTDKKIAIIPWGTGNVFAREMNISFRPKRFCKIIRKENFIKLDIAKCNNKYFFLMTSAGFDAYSIKYAEKTNLKKFIGHLAYIIGSINAFAKYKFPEIEVEIDGKIHDKGTFVLISNTSRYAMYFSITPHAIPNDGLLDVYIFKEAGRFNFIKLLAQVILSAFSSKHRRNQTIFLKKQSFYKAKKIKLYSQGKVFTQVDGDLAGHLPKEIKIIPKAVNFILPNRIIKRYKRLLKKD